VEPSGEGRPECCKSDPRVPSEGRAGVRIRVIQGGKGGTNKAESERTWQALRVCSKFEQQISRCIETEHAACHFNLLKVQLFPLQDLNAVN
jgi:hypothetical protein